MKTVERPKRRIVVYLEERIKILKYQISELEGNHEMMFFWSGACGQLHELELLLEAHNKGFDTKEAA